jgi:glucose-6-phosphate isomerase
MKTGLSPDVKPIQRRLSKMKGMYADDEALAKMLDGDDPLVYEFYDLGLPEEAGEIAFGTSIVYPGKVGDEYFMTKGHFHTILETGEVYYCLHGRGCMLMENPEGDWEARELKPGSAVYVPPRYAHRSINTSSDQTLVTFFAFRADAGHDYGTIETKGFRKLVMDRTGEPEIVDNPKWQA